MKEALCQLFLKSIEINALTFDLDLDSGNSNPVCHDIPPGPYSDLHPNLENNLYKLSPLISDRLVSKCV